MSTEIKNAINAADQEAQYDESAKRLLGQKIILAHILVKTVKEFKDIKPEDVVPFIEGTPYISRVPIEPGLTNHVTRNAGKRITGFNTENTEIKEGIVKFDIVFYVNIPSKNSQKNQLTQIIINVEAQKNTKPGYDLLNRAIFYVCRLVSSQKERDFENSNYNDIKKVYSIWICMNLDEDSMVHISLEKKQLLGSYEWHGMTDLLNIIMIGLAKELPVHSHEHSLHRLLGVLLSDTIQAEEKISIMEHEYSIPVNRDIRKDVDIMCNLSQGIMEKGIEKGIEKGRKENENRLIINMHKKGYPLEEIADITEKDIEELKSIIANYGTIFI